MISTEIDLDAHIDSVAPDDGGIFRLWLAVTTSAFFALKKANRECALGARDFLFGNNPFVDYVAEKMDLEPTALRERMKKALTRPGHLT